MSAQGLLLGMLPEVAQSFQHDLEDGVGVVRGGVGVVRVIG